MICYPSDLLLHCDTKKRSVKPFMKISLSVLLLHFLLNSYFISSFGNFGKMGKAGKISRSEIIWACIRGVASIFFPLVGYEESWWGLGCVCAYADRLN